MRVVSTVKLTRIVPLAGSALLALVASACQPPAEPEVTAPGVGGLALTSDILGDTDVAGFEYTVTPVDCTTGMPLPPPEGDPIVVTTDLEDMLIPGGNGTFIEAPYDAASGHLFADHFFWLPEGCYDVVAQPITADGEPSKDCMRAHARNVPVQEGQTTEIHLISQCRGEGAGGLDVIVSLNHPPHISAVVYDPSKFICEDTTTICFTVTDPDSDPLAPKYDTSPNATIISESVTTNEEGETIICLEVQVEGPGSAEVHLLVYDMAYDENGNLVPIEYLLEQQGDPYPSHVSLTVPVHMMSPKDCLESCTCPEGFELTPEGDECERVTTIPASQSETVYQVCKAERNRNYSRDGAIFPGGSVLTSPFFGEYWGDMDSRLNEVGVWACDPESVETGETFPTTLPTQEWIGFSACLEIEVGAEYVVGIAADNQMRFSLNGVLLHDYNTSATQNFTYWWMHPIALSSGVNILGLEGWNQSSAASFGAEIYGPFPPGSVTNDATMMSLDYENNIVWSSVDVVGQPFTMGEASGYSCPDGYVVSTCAEAPECTRVERRPCE